VSGWRLVYEEWDPEQQPLREALCTLGNGFFCTRGAAEERSAGGAHYPGTYIAGGYNRLQTDIAGRTVENEDLVNWPNWLGLTFRPEGGDWLDLDRVEILEFKQTLDLKEAVLHRRFKIRDRNERITALETRRLVHMEDPHLAGIEWRLTPENWSGRVEVWSSIDGGVTNSGVERYRDLRGDHLEVDSVGQTAEDSIELAARAKQSQVRVAMSARTRVAMESGWTRVERRTVEEPDRIRQELTLECDEGRTARIEKVAAVFTSRDRAISEPGLAAGQAAGRAPDFATLLESHRRAWASLWRRCDMSLVDSERTQRILRVHIMHLLQTTSMNTIDLDTGVPARGWHGEAYRGHIFWDELFIFPFLDLRMPELTRALLMYRRRRLDAARRAAAAAGLEGAMYPWQSGSDGREESQSLHLNPRSGEWVPDNTHLQRHVNAAIAYNIWRHYEATGDVEFLAFYGAEMLIEIARCWASLATYSVEHERYEILGVMGPDEYHDAYPGAQRPGLDNNAYTNVMASWSIDCALRALDLLAGDRREELLERVGVTPDDTARWRDVSRRLRICFHDGDIISQFEGYDDLKEFDWPGYRERYENIQRLDRILGAEGDTPNRYKVAKQADVLMLFYLFSSEELQDIFDRLGYGFDAQWIPKNIEYYLARTSHGSTLSRVVHAWVLTRLDRTRSFACFQEALESDVADVQGGTTPEGIHLGAMAGTVDLVQRCYTGVELRGDVLWFNPLLPDELGEVRLRLRHRGVWLAVRLTTGRLVVRLEKGRAETAKIGFREQVHQLRRGETRIFDLETGEVIEREGSKAARQSAEG